MLFVTGVYLIGISHMVSPYTRAWGDGWRRKAGHVLFLTGVLLVGVSLQLLALRVMP